MRPTRHRIAVATIATAACLMLAGCTARGSLGWSAEGAPMPPAAVAPVKIMPVSVPVSKVLPAGSGVPIGIYEAGFPVTTATVGSFSSATGVRPRMLTYYSGWGQGFATAFARAARAVGAVPVVKLEPLNISLAGITAGQFDNYLERYAYAVRSYRYSVILSFGHEMNGTWYSWGYTHSQPADYVAAWRHVVAVFRAAGATNVKWLWTVNGLATPTSFNLRPWWPGQQWVDVVGVDAYYYTGSDTFDHVFSPTLTALRQFTSAPVMIAETAIGGNPNRETQIHGLLNGAKANHIYGIIWFDVTQNSGLYHQNWNLEADPAAAAAFKDAVASS